ncbi:MAG: T9SS type A sorting domain-containing protein [Bacteroidales bacterium]|nr:T9SS type A sorting domain-containing protein [Bacteroidales bacterium]
MRPFVLNILFLLLTLDYGYAQNNKIVWQQCLGDDEVAYYYSATRIQDGYFLTLGISSGEEATNYHGDSDIWVLRTDTLHNVLWEKCYGGSDTDVPIQIKPITDSTFYIFGLTTSLDGDVQSGNNGHSEVWVIKINGQGDIFWEQTYGSPYNDIMNDLIVTPDGGFVFVDRIDSPGGDITQFYGAYDVWMCKCDADGNIQWQKTLGSEGLDNGVSLIINRRGNIMMVGQVQYHGGMVTCYPQGAIGNVWLVELDMQGNILWQECYGGSDYEAGFKIVEADAGYIFTGFTYSNDGDVSGHHGEDGLDGKTDIWVVKIDTLGAIVWQRCLGGSDWDYPGAVFTTNAGEILVFGDTYSNDGDVSGNHSHPGYVDVWLAKLDSNGTLTGQQCFGGLMDEYLNTHSVSKINDYRYIIASEAKIANNNDVQCTFHGGNPPEDAWFFEIKDCGYYAPAIPLQPEGPVWVYTSLTSQSTYTLPAAANSNGYVWELSPATAGTLYSDSTTAIVTWSNTFKGTAAIRAFNFNDCGSSAWSDTLYVHVDTTLSIHEPSAIAFNVYPNPAGNFVVFEIQNENIQSSIVISDLTGRPVATLPLTGQKTVWQTEGVKPGVYLYRLQTGQGSACGKLMVAPW